MIPGLLMIPNRGAIPHLPSGNMPEPFGLGAPVRRLTANGCTAIFYGITRQKDTGFSG